MNRTALPESVVVVFLAAHLKQRRRAWRQGRTPLQSPEQYAEQAVAAIRKAVDPDAL